MKRSTKLQIFGAMLAGAVVMAAQAQPFNTLKWDIDRIDVTVAGGTGAGGSLVAGGGDKTTFGGTLTFSTGAGYYAGNVFGRNGSLFSGPAFADAGDPEPGSAAPGSGVITGVTGTISFSGGLVTGGTFGFANTLGDTFLTSIKKGGTMSYLGAYKVSGLTVGGGFFDAAPAGFFGSAATGVDISKFIGKLAHGVFEELFITEETVTGATDVDMIITVPLPGGAAMASLGLFGLACRRRRA